MSGEPDVYVICGVEDLPNRNATGFELLREHEDGTQRVFSIIVVRWGKTILGYVNSCPHQETRLDMEAGQFMDPERMRLMCGKHGALFDLGTGRCVKGPCENRYLDPIALTVIDDEVCIAGIKLVEDDEEEEILAEIDDDGA